MAIFKKDEVFAGRYTLSELIGEGGFSEVWKATDSMVDDTVIAIKIYVPEKGLDNYGIRQFQKEYAITHHLSHPHLMKIYHFDIADGSPYLIMPYYQHGSLNGYLQEKGTFDETQVALLMHQMGGALANLHNQLPSVLHQDIKPHNILVKDNEYFILADFGISSTIRHTLRKSTSSENSLTTAYAPPERFDEMPFTNEASDIFSLGVTMYELCTGHVPWDGHGGLSLLKGAKVPKLPPPFPRELNRMLQACMSPDMAERPSAEQLMNWGKGFLEHGYWRYNVEPSTKRKQIWKFAVPALAFVLVLAASLAYLLGFEKNKFGPVVDETISIDSSTVFTSVQTKSLPTTTPIIKKNSSVLASKADKKSDSLYLEEGEIMAATSKASSISIDLNVASVEKPAIKKLNQYTQPGTLEEYLNQISNPGFSRTVRKQWKEEALLLFATQSAQVLNEKNGLGNRYTATALLDLLMDFPHEVKVKEMERDQQDKITVLHLEMNRQTK